jgi:hypothetical protein
MTSVTEHGLSSLAFQDFLDAGLWDERADDEKHGEKLSAVTVERIVNAYNENPSGLETNRGLGLLALTLGVAEWGVEGSDLPPDPNGKHWRSDTGEASGKHVMSYAVGGVGILHADVGDLMEFVKWVAESDLVPMNRKEGLLRPTQVKYHKAGTVYDEVRAAGRCKPPVADADLLGEPFHHFSGPAASDYCTKYRNGALSPQDWLVFRTWIRATLRTRDGQAYLLRRWFDKYWTPTTKQVPGGDGHAEETLLNVRIRNSSPVAAKNATERSPSLPGVAGRVQRELDAYAAFNRKTALRRWKIMMRPVVLYRHFSGRPALTGIGLE